MSIGMNESPPPGGVFFFIFVAMKDNFSLQADLYAKYRPNYPPELFQYIVGLTERRDAAWDCATGNGQSAKELTPYFKKVMATDISRKQLDNAAVASNIFYSVQPAERTDFEDHTFDLVTVSQALHWFNFHDFYNEVNRVGRPGAILAVWAYSLLSVSPQVDKILQAYHFETLKDYWDNERKYVDEGYATLPFPYVELKTPSFAIKYKWTPDDLKGYLSTWSALQKFIGKNAYNPLDELMARIRKHWPSGKKEVRFPIHLRAGKIQ
jgi:SAM-dependent methyltransferase